MCLNHLILQRTDRPEEQGMTFQELAIRLNCNDPSGEDIQERHPKTEMTPPRRSLWIVAGCPDGPSRGTAGGAAGVWLLYPAKDVDQITAEPRYGNRGSAVFVGRGYFWQMHLVQKYREWNFVRKAGDLFEGARILHIL